MKKKILFLYLILLNVGLNAQQQYKRCLDGEITRWSFLYEFGADFGLVSAEIVAYGDTLFNNEVYKKLYIDYSFDSNNVESSNTNWKNHTPQLYYEWGNFFIRESEDASKLYIYNSVDDEEFLISNIDLQEEEVSQIFVPSTYIDIMVDSIYFKDNLKHIDVYTLSYPFHQYTFIESVGTKNIWFLYYPFHFDGRINCFKNQSTFYKNDDFLGVPCGGVSPFGDINSISEDNYSIFIQKDKIEIFFTSNMNAKIFLYDLNGILLYEQSINSQNIVISTAKFSKGIYILKVLEEKANKQYTSKIIL